MFCACHLRLCPSSTSAGPRVSAESAVTLASRRVKNDDDGLQCQEWQPAAARRLRSAAAGKQASPSLEADSFELVCTAPTGSRICTKLFLGTRMLPRRRWNLHFSGSIVGKSRFALLRLFVPKDLQNTTVLCPCFFSFVLEKRIV